MRLIMDVAILCEADRCHFCTMRKELDCDATLVPGIEIEDAMWGEKARKIETVTLNPEDGTYYIVFEDKCATRQECEDRRAQYKRCEWRSLGE